MEQRSFVLLAQEEAARMGHNYIGTEHLLLGIAKETTSAAGRLFERLELRLPLLRLEVEEMVGRGATPDSVDLVFTPRARRVMEMTFEEAGALNHAYIGSEHLLLALIRESEGVAARVLAKKGVTRERVLETLD